LFFKLPKEEKLKALGDDTEVVERLLRALIKSLENKRSTPLFQLIWRRTIIINEISAK